MMRFYFDFGDPKARIIDHEGVDLPDAETALAEASVAAAEMAKSLALSGATGLSVHVRDENGSSVGEINLDPYVSKH